MNPKQKPSTLTRRERAAAQRKNGKVRSILLAVGGTLLLVVIVLLSLQKTAAQNVVPARVGVGLGDFTLTDIHGKTVHLSDFTGSPVLINAWATWCPPCKAEMPLLNQYYQAHAAQGFVLLAVNAGDTQAEAAAFAEQNGLAFPVLLDPGTELLSLLGIRSFPTSVLVGRDGKVKTIHIGMFTRENIESEITPLLAQ